MIYILRQWQNGNVNGVCSHLTRHRVPFRVIEAWKVEALPPLCRGDGILALGGPPSVCNFLEADYPEPFLVREAGYLREARGLGVPVMGICLGHQLIAVMHHDTVRTGNLVFGVHPVETTLHGREHWLYEGVAPRVWVYQHHRDHVVSINPGATVLASSASCAVESVAWDELTVSTQFHPEVLAHELRPVLERYPAYVRESGSTVDEILSRVPPDYPVTTSRIFGNFLYRVGAIDRPAWFGRRWYFQTAA